MPDLAVPAAAETAADAIEAPASRPRSAVSAGVGIVGILGLFSYLLIARYAPEIAAYLGVDDEQVDEIEQQLAEVTGSEEGRA